MASTYLSRNPGSAGNRRKWTFSAWVKRASLGASQAMFTAGFGQNNVDTLKFTSTDRINWFSYDNSTGYSIETTRKFRDTNAWYHIQAVLDTGNVTTNDRVIIYVNGVRETSLATNTMPSQSYSGIFNNSGTAHYIGQYGWNSNEYFDGEMSHVNFSDGYALAPTVFGSTDSTTGEWKITTSPSFTLGTNGFTILKDGNTVTDQSTNSNNWTVAAGTLTKTEDSPSNVFATGNPLFVKLGTWSNGNNSIVGSASTDVRPQMWSTLGAKTGKFYAEAKYTDKTGGMVGVSDYTATNTIINAGTYQGGATGSVGFWNDGSKYINDSASSYGSAWNNNDIIQIALDLDNECVYFGINGTWQNSGNPASGASKTGAIALTNTRDEDWFMSWGDGSQGNSATCHVNYGNGYFGTTAVASAGTNASGNGIFEYDVPTGYTALSTKGLNL